jgi:hypothetical protein
LLAQGEDPILHAALDRVGFYKYHCPHKDQGIFIIFDLPNIYMQIKQGVMLAWASTSHRGSVIAIMTPQRHHATTNVISVAQSPT